MPGGRFSHLIYPAHLEIRQNSHLKVVSTRSKYSAIKKSWENTVRIYVLENKAHEFKICLLFIQCSALYMVIMEFFRSPPDINTSSRHGHPYFHPSMTPVQTSHRKLYSQGNTTAFVSIWPGLSGRPKCEGIVLKAYTLNLVLYSWN